MENKQMFSKPFSLVYDKNYPNLSIGPIVYKEYYLAKSSTPENWIKSDFLNVQKIKRKQTFTFKTYKKYDAIKPNKELRDIQLVAQSKKTLEIELEVNTKKQIIKDEILGINNFGYDLSKLKIVENVKVPKIIDKTISDNDLKAKNAIIELFKKLKDVYKIEQLLSVGLLGRKNYRILVPTKWSITSVDDIIGKNKINDILYFKTIDKYELFYSSFYKNKFYILLLPQNWGFEQIESSGTKTFIDYEINYPKKDYANNVCGGYYAARIEVANYLYKIRRQARVIIFRDIEPSYKSLGVWVVREAIKETMQKKKEIFETMDDMLRYIDNKLKINYGIKFWKDKSNIIKDIKYQKRLFNFT